MFSLNADKDDKSTIHQTIDIFRKTIVLAVIYDMVLKTVKKNYWNEFLIWNTSFILTSFFKLYIIKQKNPNYVLCLMLG